MGYEFSGSDRRALEKLQKVFDFLDRRDVKAHNPVKTSAISTRELTFNYVSETLDEAYFIVKSRVSACLALAAGGTLTAPAQDEHKKNILFWGASAYRGTLANGKARPLTVISTANVGENGCDFVITSTDPNLAGQSLSLHYTWIDIDSEEPKFVEYADEAAGSDETDKFFDRNA